MPLAGFDTTTWLLIGYRVVGWRGCAIGHEIIVVPVSDCRVSTEIGQFQPQCIVVPANRPVTLRFAAPDVIHGILVTGTNVNTMVVPGYVSQVHTVFTKTGNLLMPCHEFCGLGHSEMWATVRVVAENEFKPDRNGRAGCDVR